MSLRCVIDKSHTDADNSLDGIVSSFKNVPDEYRPLVMWFWNDKIEKEEITYQLERYKEQNITGFFVHPMYGLEPDYLSLEFFELIQYTVSEAKRLGMEYWIYDEYNWPSGCAGGYLLRDKPWTRTTVLRAVCQTVFPGETVKVNSKGSFIGAQAVYFNDNIKAVKDIFSEVTEVESSSDISKQLIWKNDECGSGNVYFFYTAVQNGIVDSGKWSPFSWGQEGYLDTCSKEAVRTFMDYTHERYKEAIGEEFGKTVKGIFTDEPGLISIYDLGAGTLPWSKDFSIEFKKITGYDIIPNLNSLYSDIWDDTDIKVRYDYWRVISKLFEENYMGQIAKWCEDNDLILTGHLCNEESLKGSVMQSGNFFNSISRFHLPGIDSIFSKSLIETDSFNMAGKSAGSASYFLNRNRVMSETYIGSGWDLNFSDMKKIANRLIVLGINMMVLMAGHYSLKGFRKTKTCYPPSHSWHNPIFPYYKYFSDYISRLSYISSISKPVSNVLVLLPTTSAWENIDAFIDLWKSGTIDSALSKTNKILCATINTLLEMNYDFEIVFEEVLKSAVAKKGEIEIEGGIYDTLILTDITYLYENTRTLIDEYLSQGGKLIIVNHNPFKAVDSLRNCDFKVRPGEENKILNTGVLNLNTKEDLGIFKKSLKNNLDLLDVNQTIEILSGEGLLTNHRCIDNTHFYIIVNDKEKIADVTGIIRTKEIYAVLDPDTGDSIDINWKRTGDKTEFVFKLAGYASVILVTGESHVSSCSSTICYTSFVNEQEIVALDGKWRFKTISPNILKPDFMFMKIEDKEHNSDNKIITEDQWKRSNIHCFPPVSGHCFGSSYLLKAEFFVKQLPTGKLKIITESIEPIQIYMNGKEITDYIKIRSWDNENLEYDITGITRTGNNELVLSSRIPEWAGPHVPPFTVISGDFSLDEKKRISIQLDEILPYPWTQQGYPDYTGTAIYSTDFFLKELKGSVYLELSTRDVVIVRVNNTETGTKIWDPFLFDISKNCIEGINKLELVFTNTLNNLFEAPVSSGLTGIPRIIKFNRGSK